MAHIDGEIVINRPVEVVFDFVADERNEPLYNPRVHRVEQLSAGPVGVGTRFSAETTSLGRTIPMTIEVTGYERPRQLGSWTRLSSMDIHGTLTFEPVPAGTRMRWSWEITPRGFLAPMGRIVARTGSRREKIVWGGLKRLLEQRADMADARTERGDRVVVGVDLSPPSGEALRWAAEEAALRGDRLEVVYGWQVTAEPRPEDAEPGAVPPLEAYARAATRHVERFVHEVLGRGPGPDLTVAAVHHPAAAALVRAARGADLLVVGSRGHGSVSALLLGSVSNECVRLAPCPVVVVRPVQDPEDGNDPVGVDRTAATRSPAP